MAVAITDISGILVYFEKMDGTQTGNVMVALGKVSSAALFKRPTRVFRDAMAARGEGLRFLDMEGAVPIDGVMPPHSTAHTARIHDHQITLTIHFVFAPEMSFSRIAEIQPGRPGRR